MNETLNPCPFCDGVNIVADEHGGFDCYGEVRCSCGARMQAGYTAAEALEKWNTRAREAELEAERDRYAELWEMQCNETAQQSADYVDEQKRSMALEQLVRDCHEFMSRADRLQFPEIERRMTELGVMEAS